MSAPDRRAKLDRDHAELSIRRQCAMLKAAAACRHSHTVNVFVGARSFAAERANVIATRGKKGGKCLARTSDVT
jgi:hypothetical protein